MKLAVTKELVWSAVFAGVGLAFTYRAAFGVDRNILHSMLFNLGCGLSGFAIAIQPHALFERVERKGLSLQLPKAKGIASVRNVASLFFLGCACVAWLGSA